MKRVLLHMCCAPCSLMPVEALRAEGFEIMGLFFNPNIQPYTESQRRLETLRGWAQGQGIRVIEQDQYDVVSWLRQMVFREELRCQVCYHQRLTRAAQVAKRGGFDYLSTTLLFSVRQRHELVGEIGRAAAQERGVKFLHRDWRPLWKEGMARCQELGLYRQQYCGCIYSEQERYLGPLSQKQKT